MPSTRTKTPSRTHQTAIMLEAEELDALGLESSECSAGVTAGDPLPPPAARPCSLSPRLIEEALGQSRLRRTVSERCLSSSAGS